MALFNCPVGGNVRLTSPFGWRDIGRGREWHQGIDIASTGNVPIYAAADGIIKKAGVLSTYGNRVLIHHVLNGKVYETNYAHLDKILVKEGQTVKQGQQIGIMGNTGGSFGIHLHFEIHDGLYAAGQPNAVNPMNFITLTSFKPVGGNEQGNNNNQDKKDELTMAQYDELKKEIADLKKQLDAKLDAVAVREALPIHKADWEWLKANGITDGSNPQNYLTREQFSSLIKKLDQFLSKKFEAKK